MKNKKDLDVATLSNMALWPKAADSSMEPALSKLNEFVVQNL